MKIPHRLKVALLLLLAAPLASIAQEKNILIRVVQDDISTRLTDFQTTITLKKRPFKFQVVLNNVEGVYVFSSIRDSVYRFTETSRIDDFNYLKLLELREADKFNINKELNISETGWSYWFYKDNGEWHSFNRATVGLGDDIGRVCTKAVKQLYHTEAEEVVRLKSLETPLYIFFLAAKDTDASGKPLSELMRRKLKIEWVDD